MRRAVTLAGLLSVLALWLMPATASAQPSFGASFTPPTISAGASSTLTFVVSNQGAPAESMSFSAVLPTGVTLTGGPRFKTDCVQGRVTAPNGGISVSLQGARLGTGASCQVVVDVTSATPGAAQLVTGSLTSTQGDSGAASATLTVASDRPSLSSRFSPSVIRWQETSTFTMTIDNQSASQFRQPNMFSVLPSGLVVASPANASTSCPATILNMVPGSAEYQVSSDFNSFDTLNPGQSCEIRFDVEGRSVGNFYHQTGDLSWSLNFSPLNLGRAFGSLEVTTESLYLGVAPPSQAVPAGAQSVLTATITNFDRNNALTGINFTLDLGPAPGLVGDGLEQVAAPCGAESSLSGGGVVAFSGGALAPEQSCTFTIPVRAAQDATPGVYALITSGVSGETANRVINGSAASLSVSIANPLTLEMRFDPETVGAGQEATLEMTLRKADVQAALTDIAFEFSLAEFLGLVPVSVTVPDAGYCGAGSTAVNVGGADSQVMQFSGASLLEGVDFCTFSMQITLPIDLSPGGRTLVVDEVTSTFQGLTTVTGPVEAELEVVSAPRLTVDVAPSPIVPSGSFEVVYNLAYADGVALSAQSVGFTHDLIGLLGEVTLSSSEVSPSCGGAASVSLQGGVVTVAEAAVTSDQACSVTLSLVLGDAPLPGSRQNVTSDVVATVEGVVTAAPGGLFRVEVGGAQFARTFNPEVTVPGGRVEVTFTLRNDTLSDTLQNLNWNDSLKQVFPNAVLEGLPGADFCGAGSTVIEGGSFLFIIASPAPGQDCSFTVTMTLPGNVTPDTYLVGAAINGTLSGQPVSFALSTSPLEVVEALMLTKVFVNDPLLPDGTVEVEYTLVNNSLDATVTEIAFSDPISTLVPGVTLAGGDLSGVCGVDSTVTSGDATVNFQGGALAPGETCTFRVPLQAPAALPSVDIVTSTTSDVSSSAGSAEGATANLALRAAVLSKRFDPIIPGESGVLTYTIDNRSTGALSELRFSDPLGEVLAGLVVSNIPNGEPCGAGSTIGGTGTLLVSDAQLAAGETCTFSVEVTVPQDAALGDFESVSTSLIRLGQILAEPAVAVLSVVPPPPTLSIAWTPEVSIEGEVVTLSLSIDNSQSAATAGGLALSLALPESAQIAEPANAASDCEGGALTATAGGRQVSYVGGSVAARASCVITVDVLGLEPAQVAVTSFVESSAGPSEEASGQWQITQRLLTMGEVFAPELLFVGQASAWTVTLDNSLSAAAATGLVLSSEFSEGLQVADPANAVTTCVGGVLAATPGGASLSYEGGEAPAASTCTVSVDVVAVEVGASSSTTALSYDAGEAQPSSGSLTAVEGPTVSAAWSPEQVVEGGTVELTLTVDNAATLAADSASLQVALPQGLLVASTPNASTDCDGGAVTAEADGGEISLAATQLLAETACSVVVTVQAGAPGDFTVADGTLTTSAGEAALTPATLTVTALPPSLQAAFEPSEVAEQGVSRLTVTVDNTARLSEATGLSASFVLGELVLSDPVNAETDCVDGVLTAEAGEDSVSLSEGRVAAGASCTFAVDVSASALGERVVSTGPLATSNGEVEGVEAILTVRALPPSLQAAFEPSEVAEQGVSRLTVTVDNTARLSEATGLSASFVLGELVLSDPVNAETDCVDGVLTAEAGEDSVSLSEGRVSAGASCTFAVDVSASALGERVVSTGSLTTSNGEAGGVEATLNVVGLPPVLSASFEPSTVPQGAVSTLTVVVDQSARISDASEVGFEVDLNGLVLADPVNAATDCGGMIAGAPGDGVASLADGLVVAGEDCSVSFDVVALPPGETEVTVGGGVSSNGELESVVAVIVAEAGMPLLTQVQDVDAVFVGGVAEVSWVIDNTANLVAIGDLSLTATIGAGAAVADSSVTGTDCEGGALTAAAGGATVSYEAGSVPAGESCTITVALIGESAGEVSVSTEGLSFTMGQSAATSTTLRVESRPLIEVSADAERATAGQLVDVKLVITNQAEQLALSGLGFEAASSQEGVGVDAEGFESDCVAALPSVDASAASTSLTFEGLEIGAGESCTLTFPVTSALAQDVALSFGPFESNAGELEAVSVSLTFDPGVTAPTGGCECSAVGGARRGQPERLLGVLLGVLGLAFWRRRRRAA